MGVKDCYGSCDGGRSWNKPAGLAKRRIRGCVLLGNYGRCKGVVGVESHQE